MQRARQELFVAELAAMRLNRAVNFSRAFLLLTALASFARAESNGLKWISFPDSRLEVRGLPWFATNAPALWRLPAEAKDRVPKAVWARAIAPDGGRIRFASDTSRLLIRALAVQRPGKPCYFDAYADGKLVGATRLTSTQAVDLILFEKKDRAHRDLTICLPNNSEVRVLAVGVDADAKLERAGAFALAKPLVCYGSSVLQGTGAAHPSSTYPAALARQLNLDFVNLGFGGAGKAEPDVVQLIASLDASCFLFDLGKSYGNQGSETYARMLETVRAAHPTTPIICVTPIYSTKEANEPEYKDRSEKLRTLMRDAALKLQKSGDRNIFVVEGLDLFGEADKELFHDQLHPNDEGNERMADRLVPTLRKLVFNHEPASRSGK